MVYVASKEMIAKAQQAGYAVPAINIVDPLTITAVVEAAEQVKSPIIVQTSVKTVKMVGAQVLYQATRIVADRVSVPVSLHLDHCPNREVITQCLQVGWNSILFDASDRSLDQAWQETKQVAQQCHEVGATLESEIENILGVEDGVGSDELVHAYSVDQLLEVCEDAQVDLLAPQLGTAHGIYKADPVLRPDRVAEFRAKSDLPIVLHGGTGLAVEQFHEFIKAGVAKINISTALKHAYMKSALAYLKECEQADKWEPVKLFEPMIAASKQVLFEHAEIFGSAGKA